ncbi:YraN family protein [Arthrobacter rhombi]|uniref:YraN family protein n=1 Tax=Arthrobacter rhombi TaxID=71253 RepID=UPI003FD0CD57
MGHNQELGQRGEVLAAQYLMGRGIHVLARNWRCPIGEIDIVADDAGTLVAVEVKTRSGLGFGHPAEAVDAVKLRRLHRLASAWCRAAGQPRRRRRVDVIAIIAVPGQHHRVAYFKDVTP